MSLYQRGMSLKALLENPELLAPPRKQDEGKDKEESLEFEGNLFLGQSAFLGPQLWDKTITYDEADLKLEFMDLDEFLCENSLAQGGVGQQAQGGVGQQAQGGVGQQVSPPLPSQHSPLLPHSQLSPGQGMSQLGALLTQRAGPETHIPQLSPGQLGTPQLSPLHAMVNPSTLQTSTQSPPSNVHHPTPLVVHSDSSDTEVKRQKRAIKEEDEMSESGASSHPGEVMVDYEPNADDLMLARLPGEDFDPRNRTFSAEELRPQPVIKKSRKIFVPDDLKDDKYWARRKKNNVAARRSRDARRTKENQIAMRALFLERQSETLAVEVEKLTRENSELRRRLSKYEPDVATD